MKKLYTLLFIAFSGFIGNTQIVNIPDANFKAKLLTSSTTTNVAYNSAGTRIKIDTSNDGNIQVSEALLVYQLYVASSNIADLTGLEAFTNLRTLVFNTNQVTSLNLMPHSFLKTLNCSSNPLTTINVSSLSNLETLTCNNNQLTTLNVASNTNLKNLNCFRNSLTNLNLSSNSNMLSLVCYGNQLTSLDLSNKTLLTEVNCSDNLIANLNLNNTPALTYFDCGANQLTSLDISNRVNLETLSCATNNLSSVNITNDLALGSFYFDNNQFQSINLDPFINLALLSMGGNPYTSVVNLSTLTNLQQLLLRNLPAGAVNPLTESVMPMLTNLTTLNTDGSNLGNFNYSLLPALDYLLCRNNGMTSIATIPTTLNALALEGNQLTTLDFSAFIQLNTLNFASNPLSSLTLGTNPLLQDIYAGNVPLTDIDVSALPVLRFIEVNNCPNLVTLNVKNGVTAGTTIGSLIGCLNLRYICSDDAEIPIIQNAITTAGLTDCHVNSYCSFEPGGTFYTIQGNSRFDSNANGCDVSDINVPNMKLAFSNGTTTSNLIAATSGAYHYDVQAGTYSVTPTLENSSYFTITPSTTGNIVFPTAVSPFNRNYCLSANGNHNDLEVVVLRIIGARPGFDVKYKIIYKNKGTTVQNGTVSLSFNDAIEDFISANPNSINQTTNILNWNFTNLLPFETREITVMFNLNSPLETPAVNAGDLITHSATITGATDETPNDNLSSLTETVVNSLDPNEKTCIEGNQLPISEVGKYLHYIIRFENSGTANAENIVVKDIIDITKLDISTLIPLHGSHVFETKITNSNKVEFIFENINLPFDDANNDGYVAFKIKTLPTLAEGQIINNSASIYFDYNAPIVTDMNSVTIYNPLSNNEFEFYELFTLSPVPAKDGLTITTKQNVSMSSVSIYNMLGQLIQINTDPTETIDVSSLKSGNYFIKIITDKGTASSQFIKE